MGKVARQCPQTTTFLKERRAEAVSNRGRGPSAYQPNALPLGQTGSRLLIAFKSLLYSAVLRSRADSLRSCDKNEFNSAFWIATEVIYLQRCHISGATWNCCRFGTFLLHRTTMHHVTSLHAKPYTSGACMFSCNLPPALLPEWPGSFTCYSAVIRGGTDTEIIVITERWLWRRKFSRRFCRGSNPGPFDHEPGALTTELSPLQVKI